MRPVAGDGDRRSTPLFGRVDDAITIAEALAFGRLVPVV